MNDRVRARVLLVFSALLAISALIACGGATRSESNPPSTPSAPNGGSGSSTSQHGTLVYSRISADHVAGFRLNSDGSLSPLSGSPFAVPGGMLAASGTHLFSADGFQVLVYGIDAQSGALTLQSHAAVPQAGQIAAQGNFVYATGTNSSGDEAVYGFAVGQNGTLTAVAGSPVFLGNSCDLCATPESIAIDPQHLVVGVGDAVHSGGAFSIFARQENGALQQTGGIGAESIISVALDRSDRAVYAVQGGSADILVGSIGASGQVTISQSVSEPTESFLTVATEPAKRFVVTGAMSGNLISFPINSDGTLGQEASRIQTGASVGEIVFDPSGQFAVVNGSSGISVFSFDSASGKLTLKGGASTGSAAGAPVVVAF